MTDAVEQEITMASNISSIRGVGQQAVDVFESAGYFTIQQLYNFDGEDRRLHGGLEVIKEKMKQQGLPDRPDSYWKNLFTRCINIIYRAKSAQATDYVPVEYMCPISLDWLHDPVVAASGISYSRSKIEEHLTHASIDPVTGIDLTGTPLYPNIALRNILNHYRLNYQRFRILD